MYFSGIDVGSTTTKIVIIDEKDKLLCSVIGPTGAEHRSRSEAVLESACRQAGISKDDIDFTVATGYGRINVPYADKQITEITCHAKGVLFFIPDAKSVIDIGGQDCKGIKLRGGKVADFIMNDKCAAGSGRYLEVMSEALGIRLEDLGAISLRSTEPAEISNTCTVYSEQEIRSKIAAGAKLEDVVAGVHRAIARRVYSLIERIKIEPPVVFTGGGAKNAGIRAALEEQLGYPLCVTETDPQLIGAVGAALLAKEFWQRKDAR